MRWDCYDTNEEGTAPQAVIHWLEVRRKPLPYITKRQLRPNIKKYSYLCKIKFIQK